MAIEFLQGYTSKPLSISTTGEVLFTNGVQEVFANQPTCEAYGYTYDKVSGTCRAFTFSENLGRNFINENNNIQGAGNITETGTNNTYIMGEGNKVRGVSRNNIIIGSNNQIENGINNASILGNYGKAQRQGEAVIGGGGGTLGDNQSSTITLSNGTEDATPTNLFVNGIVGSTIIARESVTLFTGFEANVMGVRTGGTGTGNLYDRILLRTTGIAYLKADNQSVATLGSFGTVTGWTAAMVFSGTNDMHIEVRGAANTNISWSCTLNLYELKI
jgi:hypothetical protein